jgi:Yip1 domain
MATLAERMVGAARLDPGTYEEVEADTGATGQAALVVVISSICLAIGGRLGAGLLGLVLMSLFRLIGWYVWALVTYLIGTRLMPTTKTEADVGQLLRTLGFASTPGVLAIFGVIPGLGAVVNVVVGVWMLVAMVIAVRQALDYDSTPRAVGVVVIGFVIYLVVAALAGMVIGGLGGVPAPAPVTP